MQPSSAQCSACLSPASFCGSGQPQQEYYMLGLQHRCPPYLGAILITGLQDNGVQQGNS
jgi:hypothetical protein